jgi:hypothetical protein
VATAAGEAPIRGKTPRTPAAKRTAPVKPAGRKLLTQQAVQATQKTASTQHEGDHDDWNNNNYGNNYGNNFGSGYGNNYGNNGNVGGAVGSLIGGIIGGLVGGGGQPGYNNGGYPPNNGAYPPYDNHGGQWGEHAGQVYYPPEYVKHGDHVDYVPG